MVPNKLFRVAEFAWKLGILFVNVLNKCTTTYQKKNLHKVVADLIKLINNKDND